MNHQPFETWLLEDKILAPAEKRELDAHLQICKICSALAETKLALFAARTVSPAPGFALRFRQRLVALKTAEQRRRLFGILLFIASGVGIIGIFLVPIFTSVLASPTGWLFDMASLLAFVVAALQTFRLFLSTAFQIVPAKYWAAILLAFVSVGALWFASVWHLFRRPQGVFA
ncbi:MAG: hypothetical protein LC099_10415 [Anaerolineales bacterium]|nr:hypothetical protein [Anaerolineales bacterium]